MAYTLKAFNGPDFCQELLLHLNHSKPCLTISHGPLPVESRNGRWINQQSSPPQFMEREFDSFPPAWCLYLQNWSDDCPWSSPLVTRHMLHCRSARPRRAKPSGHCKHYKLCRDPNIINCCRAPPQLHQSELVLKTINRLSCTITEKDPTRAFSWLKVATTAFTFKNLLRHYAKQALTPW